MGEWVGWGGVGVWSRPHRISPSTWLCGGSRPAPADPPTHGLSSHPPASVGPGRRPPPNPPMALPPWLTHALSAHTHSVSLHSPASRLCGSRSAPASWSNPPPTLTYPQQGSSAPCPAGSPLTCQQVVRVQVGACLLIRRPHAAPHPHVAPVVPPHLHHLHPDLERRRGRAWSGGIRSRSWILVASQLSCSTARTRHACMHVRARASLACLHPSEEDPACTCLPRENVETLACASP